MNKSKGKRVSVILPFKIHFDKRIKTKIPVNCVAVWVLACDEQIQGKTGQRNPAMVTKKRVSLDTLFLKSFPS
jgi:hypothetical protein